MPSCLTFLTVSERFNPILIFLSPDMAAYRFNIESIFIASYRILLRLPSPCDSIQESFEAIIKVFENVSYIGELRQRWLEIKKLLKGGLSDNVPATMRAMQVE